MLWHDSALNTTTAADGDGVISFFVPDNATQIRVEVQYADGSYSQRSSTFSAGPQITSIQNDNNNVGEFELTWDGSGYDFRIGVEVNGQIIWSSQ